MSKERPETVYQSVAVPFYCYVCGGFEGSTCVHKSPGSQYIPHEKRVEMLHQARESLLGVLAARPEVATIEENS